MPLTPEDVSNKRFTAVRLREGYDMGEVDQFLDEVEAELTRLVAENDELRSKLEAGGQGATSAQQAQPESKKEPEPEPEAKEPEPEPEAAKQPEPEAAKEPEQETEQAEQPVQATGAGSRPEVETIEVTTTADASRAATRLLEMAGRNADELVAEAQQEAEQIVGSARAEAERVQGEARQQLEALEAESTQRRQSLMGDLESERARLDEEVNRLKEFERSYREELRGYFRQQLASLDGAGDGQPTAAANGTSAGVGAEGRTEG